MTGQVLQSVWIILALLGYFLVTCVFTVLSYHRKRTIDIHNRIRECMEIRRKYMTELERTRRGSETQ